MRTEAAYMFRLNNQVALSNGRGFSTENKEASNDLIL